VKARRASKAQAVKWRAELDLFGEVAVTRQDVYAWLLAVVHMDPASERAFNYVRSYGVLNKIIRAKLDGTFDDLTAPAKHSARFRELAATRAVEQPSNELGLGDWKTGKKASLVTKKLRASVRAKDVIERERKRGESRKASRRAVDATALRRLPQATPTLVQMLDDIGNPAPAALAGALGVSPATAQRWVREDAAPQTVLLALFWLTRWGASQVDANAHNDAVSAVRLARSLETELARSRSQLEKVGRIADFGSANDPVPNAPAGIAAASPYPIPETLPGRREVPIVFTSLRIAPCAAADRKKRSA
jgi:hypothetical protein